VVVDLLSSNHGEHGGHGGARLVRAEPWFV
jgi:hypothetical protein